MISESKLQAMALKYWDEQLQTPTTSMAVEFAKLVLAEAERIRKIRDAREFCASRGHNIMFRDGEVFGEVLYESGRTHIRGWKGSGKCEGCDAVLALRYPEELG